MLNYTRVDQILKKTPVTPIPNIETQGVFPMGLQPIMPMEMPTPQPVAPIMQPVMPAPQPVAPVMQPAMPAPQPVAPMMQPSMTCMNMCPGMNMCPSMNMCPNMQMQCPQTHAMKEHHDMEVVYLKKMYHPVCQKIQHYVESELDKYDHDLSPIYEMYPSQETIDYMTNCICSDMEEEVPDVVEKCRSNDDSRIIAAGPFPILVSALLLNELYRRRMGRYFYPGYSYSPFGYSFGHHYGYY